MKTTKEIITNINEYNELKERITALKKENAKYTKMYNEISDMETSDINDKIKNDLLTAININSEYIEKYTNRIDEMVENIDYLYNYNTNYFEMLANDVECTFKLMIANATSDLQNGYSFENFTKQCEIANDYRTHELEMINMIDTNTYAFAMVVNKGLTSI